MIRLIHSVRAASLRRTSTQRRLFSRETPSSVPIASTTCRSWGENSIGSRRQSAATASRRGPTRIGMPTP